MKAYSGPEVQPYPFLTSLLDESGGHKLAALPPGKNPGIHCIEDGAGSRDKSLANAGIQTPDHPACSLVTILTICSPPGLLIIKIYERSFLTTLATQHRHLT